MRRRLYSLGLCTLLFAGRPAAAVTLRATSDTVEDTGDVARLCVVLETGGAQVAGTQNDIVWDAACATLPDTTSCAVNPSHGKQLHGSLVPSADGTYRGLVLSLADVDPIPDGELYCCAFEVLAAPGECCAVSVTNAGTASPAGSAFVTTGVGGRLCVSSTSSGARPTPTATRSDTAPAGEAGTEGSGCQVSASPGGLAWAALLAAVLALSRRRRGA